MPALTRKTIAFLSLVVAVSVGSAVSHLCTSAMPLQIGALMDSLPLSATQAGLIGLFQVGALAVSLILFSMVAYRFRPYSTCLLGLFLAFLSNLAFFRAGSSLPLLCLIGALGGVGYGLIMSAAVAAAAASDKPDRTYALGNSGSLLIVVALLSLLPIANAWFGARGIFLGIAALLVVSVPLVHAFRDFRHVRATDGHSPKVPGRLPVVAILSLFSFGTGAIWTFVERIGHAIGLPTQTIGFILSASVFIGLGGTALAMLSAGRVNRILSVAIGLIGGGMSCLLLAVAGDIVTYAAAAASYWIFTMYLYVVLLGVAAQIDPTGGLGTLCTGFERLAFAISAPVGGVFVDFGSFLWIGIVTGLSCAIIAPLFLPALKSALAENNRHAGRPASLAEI